MLQVQVPLLQVPCPLQSSLPFPSRHGSAASLERPEMQLSDGAEVALDS